MRETFGVKELEAKYSDPDFRRRLFDLYNINELLVECIISDDYKVPSDLFQPIVLTDYGQEIYRQLRRKNVAHAESMLMCFLQFFHVDLLVDIQQTSRDAMIESLNKQILDRRMIFPFRYGRLLYDKFADLFSGQWKAYLSLSETQQLLRNTPQGVSQVLDLVTGPYGILRSKSYRYIFPNREIPLTHCQDFSCNRVHGVMLSTSTSAEINEQRKTLRDIISRESEHGSEWGLFFSRISAPYIPNYKDSAFDPVVGLIGDAIVDEELRSLAEWLAENSDDTVRQAAAMVGLQGASQGLFGRLDPMPLSLS